MRTSCVGLLLTLALAWFGQPAYAQKVNGQTSAQDVPAQAESKQVDSLLKFKSFFFLKEVQGNALSFLNSASDENTGHLLSRD